jgi:hypothetical protein
LSAQPAAIHAGTLQDVSSSSKHFALQGDKASETLIAESDDPPEDSKDTHEDLNEEKSATLIESRREAELAENAWLMEAIMASKADLPPLSADDVVLLRLTHCSLQTVIIDPFFF